MTRLLLILGLLLMFSVCAQVNAANTTEGQSDSASNLLFILDASGSMWGRIDGTPKIAIAKDVMSQLIADLPDNSRTGLMAYGHRRKGDCADIESLVELVPLDRSAMNKRIQGLNALGKTPITEAVTQAVEQLRQIEDSANIVLVSDGLESCDGDPCKAVEVAKQSGVDFRLHVVGFDLGDADTSQLQCMADAGGGQFFTAANADDLTTALEQAVTVEPPPAVVTGAIKLTVTVNDKPLKARTYLQNADSRKEVSRGGTSKEGIVNYTVPAGEYRIHIRPDGISAPDQYIDNVIVSAGETLEKNFNFRSGKAQITVTTNGKPLKARTYIQHADTRKEASRDGTDKNGVASYNVPVGEYRIQVRPDGISAPDHYVDNVVVTANETFETALEIPSGTAQITVTTNGKPLKARTYLQRADNHKETARGSTNKEGVVSYTVPVGEYRIQVRPDGIKAPDRYLNGVSVTATDTTEVSMDFPTESQGDKD